MKKIIYILLLLISALGFSQNDKLFREATDLYNSGKYQEAADKYEAILKNGEHSAALYYNLGNAHYKLSHVGPSIYYYEKALQLSPDDADIKNNLAFAQNMTVDAIVPVTKTGWQKFKENSLGKFSFDGWAVLSIVCICLFVVFVIAYFLINISWLKRAFFTFAFIMLLGMGMAWYCAELRYQDAHNSTYAIIYVPESTINAEPNGSSDIIFTLHAGTKVKILEKLNLYKKIQLADGKTGWIKDSDIRQL